MNRKVLERPDTMKTVTSEQATDHLGQVLTDSQLEPVVISHDGKPYSVVLSFQKFQSLDASDVTPSSADKAAHAKYHSALKAVAGIWKDRTDIDDIFQDMRNAGKKRHESLLALGE